MAIYRISRSIEASIIDFLKQDLVLNGWVVRLEKAFSRAYDGTLPCIVVNVADRPMNHREIGSIETKKEFTIEIRLFCRNDGERLDLADYLAETLMEGIDYYEYVIENNIVISKEYEGKICVTKITANRRELDNIQNLDEDDKYRHLFRLSCRVALK